jgi:hypothetical protein
VGWALEDLVAAELLLAMRPHVSRAATLGPAKVEGEEKALTIRPDGALLLEVPEDRHRCQHDGDDPQDDVFIFIFFFCHSGSTAYLNSPFKCRINFWDVLDS